MAEQPLVTVAVPPPRLLAAVAVGGAVGAVARWAISEAFPAETGAFPWSTLAINVVGAFVLALLPAFARIRTSRTLVVALGPGVLGGFTTLSTYSEQARALLDSGHVALASTYLLGTLAACLVAVLVADRWSNLLERGVFASEGGDE